MVAIATTPTRSYSCARFIYKKQMNIDGTYKRGELVGSYFVDGSSTKESIISDIVENEHMPRYLVKMMVMNNQSTDINGTVYYIRER